MNFFLLLLFTILFFPSNCDDPLSTTTTESSLEVYENLRDEFDAAVAEIIEGLESEIPARISIAKLMGASRKIGLLLSNGISEPASATAFAPQRNTSRVLMLFPEKLRKKEEAINSGCFRYQFVENLIRARIVLINSFDDLYHQFNNKNLQYFKMDCERGYYAVNVPQMESNLYLISIAVKNDGYSDFMFDTLFELYQYLFKTTFAFLPVCEILEHGYWPVRTHLNNEEMKNALKVVHEHFTKLNATRKDKFWDSKIIHNVAKDQIIRDKKTYGRGYHSYITKAIFENLNGTYFSLGYDFFVIVNKAAKLGYNETMIACSTECHYLYNFWGLDVYVMRSKKAEMYQECDYISKIQNDATVSLQSIANEIIQNCNVAAFSLIRDGLQVTTEMSTGSTGFKTLKLGDIHVTIAYYPV